MPRPTRGSPRPSVPPPPRTRWPPPSPRWPDGARWRPASGGPGSGQGAGDLLQLARMVEVVQAHEEKRLAPVERPEHSVLDGPLEIGQRIGLPHAIEQGLAVTRVEARPLRSGAQGRPGISLILHAGGRRRHVQGAHYATPEVDACRVDIGHAVFVRP